MSVDVEEHFQVAAFENQISKSDWTSIPSRVSRNVERILELFDEAGVKGTFFTLACVAEKLPGLAKTIAQEGHEIASHGCEHDRVSTFTADEFFADISKSKNLLEDLTGQQVVGYRAPSFSIDDKTPWAHDMLLKAGYEYSSSVFPIKHDHYGLPDAPRFPFRHNGNGLLEIPLSTLHGFGRNWPCSGGGYFRLLPLRFSKWAVSRINSEDRMPAVFYFHPWEIDKDQPVVDGISAKSRFRHYVNLEKFEGRLSDMLRSFSWGRMDRVFLREA
ncbi:MAG: XrtA system polysaccharide deacetylase [Pseudomonadota bacterium]